MVALKELVDCCDGWMNPRRFKDYCPNGLQVEGRAEVARIVSGVTASQALIDAAIERKADCLLVHHGYFWRNEAQPLVGMKRERIRSLLAHDISLVAYHLPLDAHPEFGNNVCLARELGFEVEGALDQDGIGLVGRLAAPMDAVALRDHVSARLGREALHVDGGAERVETVAWCTGGAQHLIEQAVEKGVDAYISGEISESTVHVARECGIHYYAAGHHATERYGVQALGELLAEHFGLSHEFVDIWNPA